MLAFLCLTAVLAGGEARARWHVEPEAVQVGEPFELVLELEHPSELSARELLSGEPTLDASWLVLSRTPARSEPAADGRLRTRQAWQVVSLEPGARSLSESLSAFAFPEVVTKIQTGEARVEVRGVLEESEDAPRPLREFPEGFLPGEAKSAGASSPWAWAALAVATLAAAAVGAWRWRRTRRRRAATVTPLERLAEIEGWVDGEQRRASCYELTRLLRESTDRARKKSRAGLTDEEWLADLRSSLDVPSGAVEALATVLERTARLKYAPEDATSWSVKETFGSARTALQAVGAGGERA